jgi:hypothetical protein
MNLLLASIMDDSEFTPKSPVDWPSVFAGARDGKTIILVLSILAVAAFIWAAFIRKRARHTHRYHHRNAPQVRHSDPKPPPMASGERSQGRKRRRRHRRRRGERKLNPTLAETGGLPPVRPNAAQPPPGEL